MTIQFHFPNLLLNQYRRKPMISFLGSLFVEATVVAIVCVFFLSLMVVAGVREILKNRDE